LNDGKDAAKGYEVQAVGNPQGIALGMSVTPEAIGNVERDRILFQSTFLSPGHSGGGLLSADGRIVGMIERDQQPYGVARRLSAILPELRGWRYIVELYQRMPMIADDYYEFESVLEEAAAKGDLTVLDPAD
jgi:Trypsin-like peptidase domain